MPWIPPATWDLNVRTQINNISKQIERAYFFISSGNGLIVGGPNQVPSENEQSKLFAVLVEVTDFQSAMRFWHNLSATITWVESTLVPGYTPPVTKYGADIAAI